MKELIELKDKVAELSLRGDIEQFGFMAKITAMIDKEIKKLESEIRK